jgi:hypothetical protein
VTLRATAAPDIVLDAVLPEPDLSRITEPLMVGLLSAGILAPRGEGYMAVSFSTGM